MNTIQQIPECEERRRGELLVKVLRLRKLRREPAWQDDRYHTEQGNKTALGLFRVISNIVQDGE